MNNIGKNIRKLRQKNGWSQGEAAQRLKISIPAFSKIETGITDINLSRLDQIAKLFNVSIFEIITKEGERLKMNIHADIGMLQQKIVQQEEEIIKLQKKIIDLYEEIRSFD
jgi:transcriptional regulator with XRE-family HTH domain